MKKALKITGIICLIVLGLCLGYVSNLFNIRNMVYTETGFWTPVPEKIRSMDDIGRLTTIKNWPDMGKIIDVRTKQYDIDVFNYEVVIEIDSENTQRYIDELDCENFLLRDDCELKILDGSVRKEMYESYELIHWCEHGARVERFDYVTSCWTKIYVFKTNENKDFIVIAF